MLKHQSLYCIALFSVAMFMTAGCAMQKVADKDDGIVPASTARKVEQPGSYAASTKQAASAPVQQIMPSNAPSADQQATKASAATHLQSALEKIYFDFDAATLSEAARSTLTKNASALMKESAARIRIEGSCDERGSAEYNLALGERRAKSAQQYLISLGVKADRLATISYGKEKPAVQGSSEAAMAKNRRDEFVVITK